MLRPVDGVTMAGSLNVQKVQEVNHNRPNLEQHSFAREMTQQFQQRQIKVPVNDASDAGNTIYRDLSGKDKRRNPKNNRSRDKKKAAQPEEPVDAGCGHHIDIKV